MVETNLGAMTAQLLALADELKHRNLIVSPEIEDTFVYGLARFDALGVDVMVNVDPEFDADPAPGESPELAQAAEFDATVLVTGVERVLEMTAADWNAVRDRIGTEIEQAVGTEPVDETTDLRDDLALMSVVVFSDAVLLSFDAPRQFPDSVIRVQLDQQLAVEDVEVDDRDENDADTLTFGSVEELLNHLSHSD